MSDDRDGDPTDFDGDDSIGHPNISNNDSQDIHVR